MRVIMVAGGTGGHIYPAIAIMNKLKEKEKDVQFLYIGTTDRMEKDIIPKLGIRFEGIPMKGLDRKHFFSNFFVLSQTFHAIQTSKKLIREFQPDIVIGAGGYITVPVLYAAHRLGIPTLIHEQNSIPGLSNQFISKFSRTICVSLPNSLELFPKEKVVYTGNPRSEEILNVSTLSREKLGFSKHQKFVIVVMGSLGSTTMTKKIKELIPHFCEQDYQVLVITGKNYYEEYQDLSTSKNVKIVPFLDNLIEYMKDADLMISRAGASTIAEITAIGLPSILVPSPYVTNNHQYKNAKELEEKGACVIVTEEEFSSDVILSRIDEILFDSKKYEEMAKKSRELGIDDSATRIYQEIKKLVR